MSNIKKMIQNYQPVNQQEVGDQKQILRYFETFSDLLTRENTFAHFSSSGFILNPELTKTLFIHHKIYNTWCWTGGHVDGETDFLQVALKEAEEETGLQNFEVIRPEIASLDILPVIGHEKNGAWVSSHQHLSVAYALIASEEETMIENKIETNGLKWIKLADIPAQTQEPEMNKVYQKIINFAKKNN